MIRRLKDDVLSELPAKRRHVVAIEADKEMEEDLQKSRDKISGTKNVGEAFANKGDNKQRAAIMEFYRTTGKAKAGSVASFVIDLLNDPSKPKILVFAHHLDVRNKERKGRRSGKGGRGKGRWKEDLAVLGKREKAGARHTFDCES
jgi:hypothetical protein